MRIAQSQILENPKKIPKSYLKPKKRWYNVCKKEIDLKREKISYTTSQNNAYICIEIW
jgi:hypothetical protein